MPGGLEQEVAALAVTALVCYSHDNDLLSIVKRRRVMQQAHKTVSLQPNELVRLRYNLPARIPVWHPAKVAPVGDSRAHSAAVAGAAASQRWNQVSLAFWRAFS